MCIYVRAGVCMERAGACVGAQARMCVWHARAGRYVWRAWVCVARARVCAYGARVYVCVSYFLLKVQFAKAYIAGSENNAPTSNSKTIVIVLSVLVGVFGVAFLIFLVLFLRLNSKRSEYNAID